MTLRTVQVGDFIRFGGESRMITRLAPYRGPLACLKGAMLAEWRPGPSSGITIEDPSLWCDSCRFFWLDCGCLGEKR